MSSSLEQFIIRASSCNFNGRDGLLLHGVHIILNKYLENCTFCYKLMRILFLIFSMYQSVLVVVVVVVSGRWLVVVAGVAGVAHNS